MWIIIDTNDVLDEGVYPEDIIVCNEDGSVMIFETLNEANRYQEKYMICSQVYEYYKTYA